MPLRRESSPRPFRRTLKALRSGGLVMLMAFALGELLLRAAGLVVHDRTTGWRPGSTHRILCVGDSHTFGAGVPPDQSYPAHLQQRLDERAPGVYSVVNLGIPGMSTTQVRNRLPDSIRRYRPDTIIVWCGVNNGWNRTESSVEDVGALAWLDGMASRLRVYRLARVWLHDRRLERDRTHHAGGLGWEIIGVERTATGSAKYTVRHHDGVIEHIENEQGGDAVPEAEWEARTARDYAAMVEYARASGVSLMFISYPLDIGVSAVANRALRKVAEQYDVRMIDSSKSLKRVPPEQRKFLWAAHPNGQMYGEIARDIVPILMPENATASTGG